MRTEEQIEQMLAMHKYRKLAGKRKRSYKLSSQGKKSIVKSNKERAVSERQREVGAVWFGKKIK